MLFIPNAQGTSVQLDGLQLVELTAVLPKLKVSFGDSLVVSAKQEPALIVGDFRRYLDCLT